MIRMVRRRRDTQINDDGDDFIDSYYIFFYEAGSVAGYIIRYGLSHICFQPVGLQRIGGFSLSSYLYRRCTFLVATLMYPNV